MSAPWFDLKNSSITARAPRAILNSEPIPDITRPRVEPSLDVLEDLRQLNHIRNRRRPLYMRAQESGSPKCSSLSVKSFCVRAAEETLIGTEPSRSREKQPDEDHEIQDLRQVQKIGQPFDCRRVSNGLKTRSYDRHNHHCGKHDASEMCQCTHDEKRAENKFDSRNEDRVELGVRNARFAKRLLHLVSVRTPEQLSFP